MPPKKTKGKKIQNPKKKGKIKDNDMGNPSSSKTQ